MERRQRIHAYHRLACELLAILASAALFAVRAAIERNKSGEGSHKEAQSAETSPTESGGESSGGTETHSEGGGESSSSGSTETHSESSEDIFGLTRNRPGS